MHHFDLSRPARCQCGKLAKALVIGPRLFRDEACTPLCRYHSRREARRRRRAALVVERRAYPSPADALGEE